MSKYIILFLIIVPSLGFSSEQIKEVLIINGVPKDIDATPLNTLFSYKEIQFRLDSKSRCTGSRRGYKGTWELIDGELFLISLVKGACSKKPTLVDPVIFFAEKQYPIKAKWFNGKIEVLISKKTYKTYISIDGKSKITGYYYDAMVYEFLTGQLKHKSERRIKHEW